MILNYNANTTPFIVNNAMSSSKGAHILTVSSQARNNLTVGLDPLAS